MGRRNAINFQEESQSNLELFPATATLSKTLRRNQAKRIFVYA